MPSNERRIPSGIDGRDKVDMRLDVTQGFGPDGVLMTDPYDLGVMLALAHTVGDPHATVLDVGCQDGGRLRRAAASAGLTACLHGLDVQDLYDPNQDGVPFCFTQGSAEHMPYTSEAFDVVTAFKVLFRGDAYKMLAETYRVLKPGGLAIASTSYMDHARVRYLLARQAAVHVSRQRGRWIDKLSPPSEPCYAEYFPGMIKQMGKFVLLATFEQDHLAIITPERVGRFVEATKSGFSLPPGLQPEWEEHVDQLTRELAERHLQRSKHPRPHFFDRTHTAVSVLWKPPDASST